MSLTNTQKRALLILAYEPKGHLYYPHLANDRQTVIGDASPNRSLAPWVESMFVCASLLRKGLIGFEGLGDDLGHGAGRVTLTKWGREAVWTIVAREDKVLRDQVFDQRLKAVERWLDGLVLPPGPRMSLAAIERSALEAIQ